MSISGDSNVQGDSIKPVKEETCYMTFISLNFIYFFHFFNT